MNIKDIFKQHSEFPSTISEKSTATLVSLFNGQVDKTPEAIALQSGEKECSYVQLDQDSNRLASCLSRQLPGNAREVVGLYSKHSLDYIIAMLAVLKAGKTCLPIGQTTSAEELKQLLADCHCDVILCTDDSENPNLPDHVTILCLTDLESMDSQYSTCTHVNSPPESCAFIMYTSGTTGKRKGVRISHNGLALMVLEQIRLFMITADDRIMQWSGIAYDSSLAEIFTSLCSGATLVIIPGSERGPGHSLPGVIRHKRITMLTASPQEITKYRGQELADLRALVVAGTILRKADIWRFVESNIICFNAYGLTETSVCATCHQINPDGNYDKIIPVGKSLDHLQICIIDREMKKLPPGEEGELCICGSGLSMGYVNTRQRNKERFIPNPFEKDAQLFRSGDRAYLTEDGSFVVTGRMKKQELTEAEEQSNHLEQRGDAILEHLRNEGYRPALTEDGRIELKREGHWYLINMANDDEQFYQIFKPQFWPLESDEELQRAYQAASNASRSYKGAKTFVNGKQDNVMAAMESFCHDVEAFNLVFERSIGSLISMVNLFGDEMRLLKQE